jgi:hypothetical protein
MALKVEFVKFGAFAQPGGETTKGSRQRQGQRQQQISPQRRQSTPPSVEMTILDGGTVLNEDAVPNYS